MTIKPVLKYPGAKSACAEWIVEHLPPHVRYAEPYTGSGAVFFNKPKSRHEVLNDLDGRLVNALRVMRDHGDELIRRIDLTPHARSEYYASYAIADDPIEDARRFFVRCWMAHGYKPYCRTGWRHNGSKSLQPVSTLWNDVPNRLHAAVRRIKDAEIECIPALAIIERYHTADTLIYADPPYVMSTRNHKKIYAHEMTDADHLVLLDALDAHPGSVVLSGYDCDLYNDRLSHWHKVAKQVQDQKGQPRTEVLWLNDRARPRMLWDLEQEATPC